jgi:fermentation-respiration switch protein FrsA (DUF1100 family)
MRGALSTLAVSLFLAWSAFAALLYALQASLIYFPDDELIATPADRGLAYRDVALTTEDGVRLHAWLVTHPHPRGAVVYFHGNAGNISHRLQTLSFWHGMGFETLIVDYRGYGRSEGTPEEEGTYRDALAAWRYLTGEHGVPADRVVVFGRSLGAAVAIWLASREQPAALIAEAPFTSIPDLGQTLYPFMPVRLLARIHYDNRGRIGQVRAPVLVAHSPDDEVVPFEQGREVFAAAAQPKRFMTLAGGHNTAHMETGERYGREMDAFLRDLAGL